MKILSTIVALFLATTAVYAQDEDDNYMFNHMSFGITAGTPGAGLELAMPLGKYVQVRAGATYMPPFTVKTSMEQITTANDIYKDELLDIKSTPNFLNGKIMFDLYPSPSFPLHVTLGAYIGAEKIMDIVSVDNKIITYKGLAQHNREECNVLADHYAYNRSNRHGIEKGDKFYHGVQLGDYTLLPDKDGKINSRIETSMIRPYAGLGWGKAVSDKSFDWMIEAGVIFWNTPKLFSTINDPESPLDDKYIDVELQKNEGNGQNAFILKEISKLQLYPVINFRIGFNMF